MYRDPHFDNVRLNCGFAFPSIKLKWVGVSKATNRNLHLYNHIAKKAFTLATVPTFMRKLFYCQLQQLLRLDLCMNILFTFCTFSIYTVSISIICQNIHYHACYIYMAYQMFIQAPLEISCSDLPVHRTGTMDMLNSAIEYILTFKPRPTNSEVLEQLLQFQNKLV